MTNWKAIRKEYETTSITMKDLAEKHNVKYSTLRSRKSRENWQRGDATNVATDDASKNKRGAPKGNKNAKGNSGGAAPKGNQNAKGDGAPEGNKNAVSHGLFANWLPEESLEIIRELSQKSPADMIWENILIQYTAIIRAQKIMYVKDSYDDINNITSLRLDPTFQDDDGKPVQVEEKREWHMAYEKQEAFMNAQSRAMGTLSNLIKQFVTLADEQDERRLKLEKMRQDINVSNAKLELMKDMLPGDEESTDDGFLAALEEQAEDLWPEE